MNKNRPYVSTNISTSSYRMLDRLSMYKEFTCRLKLKETARRYICYHSPIFSILLHFSCLKLIDNGPQYSNTTLESCNNHVIEEDE